MFSYNRIECVLFLSMCAHTHTHTIQGHELAGLFNTEGADPSTQDKGASKPVSKPNVYHHRAVSRSSARAEGDAEGLVAGLPASSGDPLRVLRYYRMCSLTLECVLLM